MLPFLLVGESVLPGGRVTVSSMSHVIRDSATPALTVSVSILAVSDSIPTVTAVLSVASRLNSSLSSGISARGLHRSEGISGVITRKCVFSDMGMDSGHTGGGSDLTLRNDGWKGRKEKHRMTETRLILSCVCIHSVLFAHSCSLWQFSPRPVHCGILTVRLAHQFRVTLGGGGTRASGTFRESG